MAQLISIQQRGETADAEGKWQAVVRFNNGPENPITISPPFSDEEEKELEWYFEEHMEFPFTRKVRARDAAKSVAVYGEKLFKQVFGDGDIYSEYRNMLKAGPSDVAIEIEGSPNFHALHWEALKDPKFDRPLALQATMVRKNKKAQKLPLSIRPSPTINLLIVTARPSGKRDVGYRTISRPLVEALRNANLRVQVDILRPGTYKALEKHLRETTAKHGEGYYSVVHFDVHGAVLTYAQFKSISQEPDSTPYRFQRYARDEQIPPYEGVKAFLSFEPDIDDDDKTRQVDLVEASELAALLVTHQVPITILNACQSGKQIGARETSLGSRLVQEGVQLVLAMGYSVNIRAAELMMQSLYTQLFAGDDLSIAIRHARTELYNDKKRIAYFDQRIDLEDWLLPVVYQNQPLKLAVRDFMGDESNAWYERKAEEERYTPPDPQYGFVGRDIDILQVEKHLLSKRNILLIRGMGGAGKTTLLKHLGAWWHTTGLVQRVFYFGYDEKAWTLEQIMFEIAQQLYGTDYTRAFQPLSSNAKAAKLVQDLRAHNHLLVLDNLESITGAHLAIQHTLPKEEQQALYGFLTRLAKGKTLILLGSRGGEDWLAKGTFDDNLYDLPGLDDEAASTLADRILERNGATKYRTDEKENENLRKLIKLLDGFPLALEVVLANLRHQTPGELLEALQAGDVRLDTPAGQQKGKDIFEQKTESILRCIDYSHSNLSPDAQQLLLCLAPFTSVIWIDYLDEYTDQLRQQPVLANLPFDRWPEVILQAQNWGLLSPHEVSGFLHLQPTLTYFLRNRLHETGQVEVRGAIETAFREHYDQLGGMLHQLLKSKDPQERITGQVLTSLEYENLVMALNLVLEAHGSIKNLYFALSAYLDVTQDQRRGLELGQTVLACLEKYPTDKLSGSMSYEFARVVDDIGLRQLMLKQYVAAESSYQKVLSLLLENQGYDADEMQKLSASVYHQLGRVAQEQRQWQQAEQHYQQALQIDVEYNDRYSQAGAYHQLGRIAEEQQQWQQAEQYFRQALLIFIELKDRHEQAGAYQQLGVVAAKQQQWQQAEQYFRQALLIFIELKDRYWQASIYHKLGVVVAEQRQWQQAEQYYQQALQIYIEYNDRYDQADTYHQLGIVAEEQRQWQQAEQYYHQALQIKLEFNDRYNQARTYHQLGLLTQEQRQWQQAEQYYQQALQIYIEYNDRYQQAGTYHQLGRVSEEQDQWQQAREYFLQALEIYEEYKGNYSGSIVMRSLSRLWKASDDAGIPAGVARILGVTAKEAEKMLREWLEEGEEQTGE